ncbi:MAG: hypothetical protein RLZZ127_2135, partial [Planctomycetota bacterium]
RLATEILKVIGPDKPKPVGGAQVVTAEARERIGRAVSALAKNLLPGFNAAVAKVDANLKAEESAWDLDETKDRKKIDEINEAAVNLRYAALFDAWLSMVALREVAVRGGEFGIPDAVMKEADAAIAGFLSARAAVASNPANETNLQMMQSWDFNWGERNGYITLFVQSLLGEGVRLKVKGASADDVQGELVKIASLDAAKTVPEARFRPMFIALQLKCWNAVFRMRLGQGTPQALEAGVNQWKAMQGKDGWFKDNPSVTPESADKDIRIELARLHMTVAKVMHAKGDKVAAGTVLGAIANARRNELRENAQLWIRDFVTPGQNQQNTGNEWAAQPVATDPETALSVARSFFAAANDTADVQQQRTFYLTAAVALRGAVLGLTAPGFERNQFPRWAPDIYERYAFALSKLDMRWQAAIVAQEGLRQIQAFGATDKKGPWRTGDGKLAGDAGKALERLARNGQIFASQLRARADGPAATVVSGSIIELAKAVAPETVNDDADWVARKGEFEAKRWEDAIKGAQEMSKKRPDQFFKCFAFITSCRMKWHGELAAKKDATAADKDRMAKLRDEMAKSSAAVVDLVNKQLPAEKDPAKKKELLQALTTAKTVEVFSLSQAGKHEDILNRLGGSFWTPPPADRELGAQMLRAMAIAAARFAANAAVDEQKKPRTDAAAFLAAWKRLEEVHAIAAKQLPRYTSDEDPLTGTRKALFNAFLTMQRTAEFLASNAKGDKPLVAATPAQAEELARIQELATRFYADAIEPTLSSGSEPALLQSVAFALDELGDGPRAGRIYDLALAAVGRHAGVAAYRADAKAWLDDFQAKVLVREDRAMQEAVKTVRDLLEDTPGTRDALAKGQDLKSLPEKPINYALARRALGDLRKVVNEPNRRTLLGDKHGPVVAAIDEAEKAVGQLNQEIAMLARRAALLRSEGRKAEANAIYNRLIDYDPLDGEFQSARIDITLDLVKAGQKVEKATIEKAIQDAISFRTLTKPGTERWWLASIQVMELSIANGDPSPVDDWLRRMRVDNSDISVDLIAPPPMGSPSDAKGVRRARDQQAVALANRFLQLYGANGVKEKPGFRIETIEFDGRRMALFVAPDTPALEIVAVTDPNTDDTWSVVWEKGKAPPVIELQAPAGVGATAAAAPASATTAAGK